MSDTTNTSGSGRRPVSGDQHRLRVGEYEAVVASVGATLRVLRDDDGDLVVPFSADEMRPSMRGAVLAPWPNRTANGRYVFEGQDHQLPVNESDFGNAAHGLVAWLDFRTIAASATHVVLESAIEAQPGYPWRVRVEVVFSLTPDGLVQRITATNESVTPAPFGAGGHPYIVAGPAHANAVDDWFLEVRAHRVVTVSPERLLPVGIVQVDDHEDAFDFRTRRPISGRRLNHAFGALEQESDGYAHVRVTDDRGVGVDVACDSHCRWVQLYTSDTADPLDHRHSIAVEPMTCPPDALNSKQDLIVLQPGASAAMEWRIARIRPRR